MYIPSSKIAFNLCIQMRTAVLTYAVDSVKYKI